VVGSVRVLELDPGAAAGLTDLRQAFRQLSGCDLVEVIAGGAIPAGRFASVDGPGVKALLDLQDLVDVDKERDRLVSKAKKAYAEAAKARAKLSNQGFVAKAPEAVVAEERSRLAGAESVLDEVRRQYQERVGGELPGLEGKGS